MNLKKIILRKHYMFSLNVLQTQPKIYTKKPNTKHLKMI